MMTYDRIETLNLSIAKVYPTFVKDLNLIILTNDNQLKTIPEYFTEVVALDLDDIQEEIATQLKKNKDSSLYTCFVVSHESKKKVILVELKLNVENPNNYFNGNKARRALSKKIEDSIQLLGNTVPINSTYYLVFKPYSPQGKPVLEIAKRLLFNISQELDQNYKAISIDELKQTFFQEDKLS